MFGIHILAADGAHLGIDMIGVRLLAVNQPESGFQAQISLSLIHIYAGETVNSV